MTAEPETFIPPQTAQPIVPPTQAREIHSLESLFYLGYAESQPVVIYKDDKNELKVKFRTLTPAETRDVNEEITKYFSPHGQAVTEQIESLARAIVWINYMPLVLTREEQNKFFEDNKRNPSPLEMARIILRDKIKSLDIMNSMYKAYLEFQDGVSKELEDAKKKSNSMNLQTSSSV